MKKCLNPDCDRLDGHSGECRRESPRTYPEGACNCEGIVGPHERDEWCPREFPLGGFCKCGQPDASLHSCPERTRAVTPADQALETQALIAAYRLAVIPQAPGWFVGQGYHGSDSYAVGATGPTSGDAVRACVERIQDASK